MYMDDIKLFDKNESKVETDSKNIQPGYWDGIRQRKSTMLIMRRGKRDLMEGIELPNQEKIRILGENNYRTLAMVRVFANGPGELGSIPGRVIPKTQKWYLMPPCLTLSIIRYGSRAKWVNPGKGVAPSLTPWCSSYRKGSLRVTLDYGRQLYFTNTWKYWKRTPLNKWRWKKKNLKKKNNPGKLLVTELHSRNLIKKINTWAVSFVRYSAPFWKWTREEIQQMDPRTRKLMTMHKALHLRKDVDRLYVPRKEGERGLTSIQDGVDASVQWLEDYIKNHGRRLNSATRNTTDKTSINRTKITRKQKWVKKTTVWTFQATNKLNLLREILDLAKKGKL